jgi:hypothetical protein
MSRMDEPVRWLDPRSDAPDGVRRLLAEARDAVGPTPEELARLQSLVAAAAVGAGAGAAKAAAMRLGSHALTKAGILKLAAAVAVGSAGAGVSWSVLHHAGAPQPPVFSQAPGGSARTVATVTPQLPLSTRSSEEPVTSAAPEEASAVPPPSVEWPSAPPPSAPRRAAPVATPDEPRVASAAPPPEPATALVPGTESAAPPPATTSPATPGESELALLDRARSHLSSDPAEAIRALDEHRARYPRGTFAQEREVLAIEALVRLGRRGEAQARADAFARAFPGSAHLRRIAVLLGEDGGG